MALAGLPVGRMKSDFTAIRKHPNVREKFFFQTFLEQDLFFKTRRVEKVIDLENHSIFGRILGD